MPKVIVLIADPDDPKHGEIAVLDSNVEAERLVEVLLEAGTPPGRIRIFSGAELEAQVTQKPRVELVECEWAETPAAPPDPWQTAPASPVRLATAANGAAPAGDEARDRVEADTEDEAAAQAADEDEGESEERVAAADGEDAAPDEAEEPAREPAPSLTLLRRLPQVELMPELKH
jgi:hypothetical protein